MAKKKFICKVCGYVHEGDAAPEKCPVCNAPASEFVEQKPKGLFSDVNSNAYIILYSVVMVVLVAALLAVASFSLQDRQNANILNEKQQQIVKALGEDPMTVKYGDVIAEILTPLRERQLSKTLLEVLSTIAYRQPITRLELEEMRGKSDGTTTSCEYAITGLLKAGLIEVVGRKETVGRPFLYGTTDEFLKKFGLTSLDDLPDAAEVLEKLKEIYAPSRETLFGQRDLYDEDGNLIEAAAADEEAPDDFPKEEEIPDFLAGEEIEVFD